MLAVDERSRCLRLGLGRHAGDQRDVRVRRDVLDQGNVLLSDYAVSVNFKGVFFTIHKALPLSQ